jgi:transcriptional antiterminator NusG
MALVKTTSEEEIISTTNGQVKWYIIQTYTGFEDAVRRALELKIQNMNLSEKVLEMYIPTKKITILDKKGQRKEKTEKVYPGYLYMKMLLDKETGYLIQNTSYVSRIAGTGDVAVPLSDGYVENLKESLLKQSEDSKTVTKTVYDIGDLVEVDDGPFKDMRGKISSVSTNGATVDVLLTMFERETLVTLDALAIHKVL